MKTLKLTLLAIFVLPLLSQAQSNFKPGYIVNLKGDTVKGSVDYREWNENPTTVDFKSADNGPRQTYKPADISAFGVDGLENYITFTGSISMDRTDIDHVSSVRDTSMVKETVLLKVLQKGKNVALYSYTDELKTRLYIGEAPNYVPNELVYRIYMNDGSARSDSRTAEENTYMKQLFTLANKYNVMNTTVQWDIEHSSYNKDRILKVVSQINHFTKADQLKSNGNTSSFGLIAGVGVSSASITTPAGSPFYAAGGRGNTSLGPVISFGINLFANPNTQRLQFRLEGAFSTAQFKSLYTSQVSPYIPMRASFDQRLIAFKPEIIYNVYNAQTMKVFLGVGASLDFMSYSNAYLGSQAQPNSAADIEKNEPFMFNSSDASLLFKAGIQFSRHLGIYAEYQTQIQLDQFAYWDFSSTFIQAGVNYYFK